jgi:nucleotide-binding universal stress UspA family protein
LSQPVEDIHLFILPVVFKHPEKVAISCSAFRFLICRCRLFRTMVDDENRDILARRIIVPVDGSPGSEKALDYAIRLAKAYGAQMQIIHAIRHIELTKTIMRRSFSSKAAFSTDELYEDLKREAYRWIDEYERKAKSAGVTSVTTKILVEVGKSEVQMIAEHADAVKADMIVMGSRGLGTFKRLVLGSIANGVVSHALCPVLVVR